MIFCDIHKKAWNRAGTVVKLSLEFAVVGTRGHWNSPAKWQATACFGRNMRVKGVCSAQIFRAIGQRV